MIQNFTIKNDDSLLVRELSKGNLLAFNTLYYEYSSCLYRSALGYLKSKEASEELVQDVFTKIWEKRANLKEELSFKALIFTIAFNIIRKHLRTKAYLSDYIKTRASDDLDMQTSQKITYDSLYQYITVLVDQLSERSKEIFIKSRFEGLSIKEIATEYKISHKIIENQLTDALKFIRTNLSRENILVLLCFTFFFFHN